MNNTTVGNSLGVNVSRQCQCQCQCQFFSEVLRGLPSADTCDCESVDCAQCAGVS